MKNGKTFSGYKNHIKIDNGSKLISFYAITPTSVHDSVILEDLFEGSDESQQAYAGSVYCGKNCDIAIKAAGMDNRTYEKAYRNRPRAKQPKKFNTLKPKTQTLVEHVFGYQLVNLNAAQLIR